MDFLALPLILVALAGFVWGVFYAMLAVFQNREIRRLGRVVQQGRFGLKSAIGAMAFVAVTLGLMTGLGGDITNPGSLCLLAVVAPVALFLVGFVGLMLTELFDRDSTRQMVARRAREDEIDKMFRERREQDVVDAEVVEPSPESQDSDGSGSPGLQRGDQAGGVEAHVGEDFVVRSGGGLGDPADNRRPHDDSVTDGRQHADVLRPADAETDTDR
jgi:hypothetical protein